MAYNFREKKSTAYMHSEELPVCSTICVGRGTTLPQPLLNEPFRAWYWTSVLMVRWEIRFAICKSAQNRYNFEMSLQVSLFIIAGQKG